MFTSLEIDEELFNKAYGLSGLKTKKAVFEEVLRVYVRLHEQAGVQSLRGKLAWDGDLAEIRRERGAGPR
jgi:Arc/MetJ family transcription regulator